MSDHSKESARHFQPAKKVGHALDLRQASLGKKILYQSTPSANTAILVLNIFEICARLSASAYLVRSC